MKPLLACILVSFSLSIHAALFPLAKLTSAPWWLVINSSGLVFPLVRCLSELPLLKWYSPVCAQMENHLCTGQKCWCRLSQALVWVLDRNFFFRRLTSKFEKQKDKEKEKKSFHNPSGKGETDNRRFFFFFFFSCTQHSNFISVWNGKGGCLFRLRPFGNDFNTHWNLLAKVFQGQSL